MKNIEKLWSAFEQTPFPLGHRTKEVAGYNLTILESEIGGLIMTCLRGDGTLGRRQYILMGKFCEDLPNVIKELEGDAANYFKQLSEIASLVYAKLEPPADLLTE